MHSASQNALTQTDTAPKIIGVIKEHDAGVAAKELCRRHGISPNTFYKWKSKFGGMDVSDVAKMRSLRDENGRLKRIVADLVLERDALKIVAEGNFWRLHSAVEP